MSKSLITDYFPEVAAGGFSRTDGSVEFYARVNALLSVDSVVLDFGAGRGRFLEDPIKYRRNLRTMRGRVRQVIGVDVDSAVLGNPSVDVAYCVASGGQIPIAASSVDVVISDFTFEHIESPAAVASELG